VGITASQALGHTSAILPIVASHMCRVLLASARQTLLSQCRSAAISSSMPHVVCSEFETLHPAPHGCVLLACVCDFTHVQVLAVVLMGISLRLSV
jgi:hypothetical protein